MSFAEPVWLVVGGICLASLLFLYPWSDRRQREALGRFAAGRLVDQLTASISPARRVIRRTLLIAGAGCLFLALARPQVGYHWEEVKREGIDILFAVDVSKSMLAQDIKPDRLTRAKLAVTDLVRKLDGDRVGLIAFAGTSFLQCPLTLDYDAFYQSLQALDTTVIPRGGTNIAAAIREAETALEGEGAHEKILILLTDGEDLEGSGIEAAQAAAQDGLRIFTIGVGGSSGELIPVPGANGGTEFLKDEQGNYVKSKLDEGVLKKLAEETKGAYEPLGRQGEGLEAIYQSELSDVKRHEVAARQNRTPIDRFQWPLAAGLFLLIAERLIGTRRRSWWPRGRKGNKRNTAGAPAPVRKNSASLAGVASLLALLATGTSLQASPASGQEAYTKGDYPSAEKAYAEAASKNPARADLNYNLGTATYKTGKFDEASGAFEKSLAGAEPQLQQQAYYNLGNVRYRQGQATEQKDPQTTIKAWEEAVQNYEAALQINPDDADAKFNMEFVKKKLEELKKQQQQQDKKDDQKQDQNKNQDNKDQNQDQQNQAKQDQDSKGGDQNQKDQQSKPEDQQNKQDQQNKASGKNGQNGDEKKQDGKDQDQPKPQQASDKGGQPDQKEQKNQAEQGKDQQKDGQNGQAQQPQQGKGDQKQPAGAGSERRAPGQMTKEEAARLLDSLKNDEAKMPLQPVGRADGAPQQQNSGKDW